MAFDSHKEFTIKNAYSHLNENFASDDKRDRDFVPESVKTSIGFVRGFYFDESEETIYLIVKNDNYGVHYRSISSIPTEDAILCAEKILADAFTLKINRHHELYVGEKVYDNDTTLVCEVVKIDGDKVLVSQQKYIEHNKIHFDLDCDQDPMAWVADADSLYQFAEGVTDNREGQDVCYEHTSIDYPFFSPYLYENLYTFEVNGLTPEDRAKYIKEENGEGNCNDDEVVYDNEVTITKGIIKKAEQVLIDSGIEKGEACVVLQALGYVLFDGELYPEPI